MAVKNVSVNFAGASAGNLHLDQMLRSLHQRIAILERGAATEGLNPDQQSKVASPPPRATLEVIADNATGEFRVQITNPEFALRKGRNPLRTALSHKLEYSTDSQFKTNVTSLPVSTQTFWPIRAVPGTALHFRITSSYDGKNWNLATTKAASLA